MTKATYFYDDFSVESVKWYATSVDTGVITGGQMRIQPTSSYDYVGSSLYYDMTDSAIGFKLVENTELGLGSNEIALFAVVDSGNSAGFVINGGRAAIDNATITMRSRVAASNSDTTFTYDPAVHVWFRVREAAGTLYWETSADSDAWTVHRTLATPIDLTNIFVQIQGGYWDAEATTYATIDDFNLWDGVPPYPKASTFTDSFSSSGLTQWYFDAGWSEVGGLTITPTLAYDYIQGATLYDFVDSHYGFQLVQNANAGITEYGGSITTEFRVKIDDDNYLSFLLSGGGNANCVMRESVGDVRNDASFIYNSAKDKWFRIRSVGATIYWETSFDGATWSIKRSKTTSLNLSVTMPFFVAGYWNEAESDVGTVVIDNFNLFNDDRLKEIGWYYGPRLTWGGIDGGTVQTRNYFPVADWMWEPIPPSPVLNPVSSTIGSYLTTPGGNKGILWCWYANALVHPNQITPSTPRYRVSLLVGTLHPDWDVDDTIFDEYDVPIPYGTQVPPGSDSHLVVADPVSGKVFSFWQMYYDEGSDTWTATYGSVGELYGDGRDTNGSATATNISRYAGVIRLAELEAGEIPHALFVASNMCTPGPDWTDPSSTGGIPPFIYPAAKSDGRNMASVPVEYTVVQGARLQLDPSIDLAAIPGITQIELTIGKCWQRYGAYVGDQGGTYSPPTVQAGQIELWQGQDYSGLIEGVDDPTVPPILAAQGVGWDYFDLTNIPWEGNIRVLKNWDGSP